MANIVEFGTLKEFIVREHLIRDDDIISYNGLFNVEGYSIGYQGDKEPDFFATARDIAVAVENVDNMFDTYWNVRGTCESYQSLVRTCDWCSDGWLENRGLPLIPTLECFSYEPEEGTIDPITGGYDSGYESWNTLFVTLDQYKLFLEWLKRSNAEMLYYRKHEDDESEVFWRAAFEIDEVFVYDNENSFIITQNELIDYLRKEVL